MTSVSASRCCVWFVRGSQPLSQTQLGQVTARLDRHYEVVGKGCGCGCRIHTTPAEARTGSSLMQFSVLKRRLDMHILCMFTGGRDLGGCSTLNRHQRDSALLRTTTLTPALVKTPSHEYHIMTGQLHSIFSSGQWTPDLDADLRRPSTADTDWNRHIAITVRLLQLLASLLQV